MNTMEETHALQIARVLGDPVRLSIYRHIVKMDEMRCGDICRETPVRASTVSHHLKMLSDAGLIKSRRDGQSVYYRWVPARLEAYLGYLRKLYKGGQTSRKVAIAVPTRMIQPDPAHPGSGMPNRPRVIAFLVASAVDLLNLIGLASVFSYPKIDGKPAYSIKILSVDAEQEVRGVGGIAVSNGILFSEYAGPIDTLVAISGEGALGELSEDVFHWIRKRAARVRRIAAVCTGTFMLAPTGVLDGKRVTTHWHHVDRLAKQFPHLLIEKDPIFIKDGKVYTTAGVTAGIDMALTLVEEDLGHAAATSIARELVLYIRRPGSEAQYSTLLAQQADVSGTPMRDLPAWAQSRLTQRLDVHTLAKAVSMTPRTFARQFEIHFRTTPARWVQSLRVEAACGHLEAQELPVKAIAKLTGFRDEQSLRRAFLQQISMTPKDYRDRFGAFLASDLLGMSKFQENESR